MEIASYQWNRKRKEYAELNGHCLDDFIDVKTEIIFVIRSNSDFINKCKCVLWIIIEINGVRKESVASLNKQKIQNENIVMNKWIAEALLTHAYEIQTFNCHKSNHLVSFW